MAGTAGPENIITTQFFSFLATRLYLHNNCWRVGRDGRTITRVLSAYVQIINKDNYKL